MKIKELREKSGMSQMQLADELGLARSTVAMWETGQAYPRTDTLLAMAELFGCTLDELVKKEGEAQ